MRVMAKTQMVLVLVIFYAVDTSLATVFATANPLARSQCATRQASPWHIIIFVFILAYNNPNDHHQHLHHQLDKGNGKKKDNDKVVKTI